MKNVLYSNQFAAAMTAEAIRSVVRLAAVDAILYALCRMYCRRCRRMLLCAEFYEPEAEHQICRDFHLLEQGAKEYLCPTKAVFKNYL